MQIGKRLPLLSVLTIPSFRHLWIGQLCSQLAVNMMLFLLAIKIYDLTKSNAAVSALYLTYGLPAAAGGIVAGVAVDHLDKRSVLAFCNIGRMVLMTLLLVFPESLWAYYVVMMGHAILSQFYVPAEAPLIPRFVPASLLYSANSIFSFTFFTSMASGFIVAGPILRLSGTFGAFVVITVLYIVAVLSVLGIPRQREDVVGLRHVLSRPFFYIIKRIIADFVYALGLLSNLPRVIDSVILLTLTQVVLALLAVLGPGYADQILAIDVADASLLILGPAVLGIMVGAILIGIYGSRYKTFRLTNMGLYGIGVLLLCISGLVRIDIQDSIWGVTSQQIHLLSLLLFFSLGIANSFLDVPANATIQSDTGHEIRGKVYGIFTSISGGIGILPVVGGAFLADYIGIGRVLMLVGSFVIIFGLLRQHRGRRV